MKLCHLYKSVLVGFVFFAANTLSAAMTEEVLELQDEWARIKYLLPEKEQVSAFQLLSEKAARISEAQQHNPEALIWEGIILSTYAGVKGGLGALGLVKRARDLFEQAMNIDPAVMDGSAYTSLGSLYYQVPSWPVGFGDDEKALEFLNKGLQFNPDGIDSNYFYGDYLLKKGDYAKAEEAFNKALLAPAREGREVADKGRRKEIEEAMAKLKSQQTLANRKNSMF